jgi:hypothetical protein
MVAVFFTRFFTEAGFSLPAQALCQKRVKQPVASHGLASPYKERKIYVPRGRVVQVEPESCGC